MPLFMHSPSRNETTKRNGEVRTIVKPFHLVDVVALTVLVSDAIHSDTSACEMGMTWGVLKVNESSLFLGVEICRKICPGNKTNCHESNIELHSIICCTLH